MSTHIARRSMTTKKSRRPKTHVNCSSLRYLSPVPREYSAEYPKVLGPVPREHPTEYPKVLGRVPREYSAPPRGTACLVQAEAFPLTFPLSGRSRLVGVPLSGRSRLHEERVERADVELNTRRRRALRERREVRDLRVKSITYSRVLPGYSPEGALGVLS